MTSAVVNLAFLCCAVIDEDMESASESRLPLLSLSALSASDPVSPVSAEGIFMSSCSFLRLSSADSSHRSAQIRTAAAWMASKAEDSSLNDTLPSRSPRGAAGYAASSGAAAAAASADLPLAAPPS